MDKKQAQTTLRMLYKFTLSESMLEGWKNTLSIYEVLDTSVSLAIQKSLSLFVDSGDLLSFSQ